MKHGLRDPIDSEHVAHLCVDMQRMFAEDTAWRTPWIERVLPVVEGLVARAPERVIFTRFIPAARKGEGEGTWRRYYRRWTSMTIEELGMDMVDILPTLARFVPPGTLFDKHVYSPWHGGQLHAMLRARSVNTLIISGGETDVCVLATVLGAVDFGYRIIVVTDALCSSSDKTHDALITLYQERYGEQVETATSQALLDAWP